MRYLFAGGGTGGHLFPGLALAEELILRDPEAMIRFVGTREGLDRELVPAAGMQLELIAAGRGSPLMLRRPLNLPRFALAVLQSWRLLRSFRPDAVIALGGFAAAAPGLAARLTGTPLVVLEQNSVPGRVNRLLARWAKQVHLQFAQARAWLKTPGRILDSGSPMRRAMLDLMQLDPAGGDALLVVGGSQGAQALNDLVLQAAPRWQQAGVRILHVAGAQNEADVRQAYAAAGVEAEVIGFCSDMPALYRRARLCISRAGAGSCAELALSGLPSLLVPLPSAADDHQRLNALAIAESGGANVFEQQPSASGLEARGAELAREVLSLWNEPERLRQMGEAIRTTARPEAGAVIAEAILDLVRRESA